MCVKTRCKMKKKFGFFLLSIFFTVHVFREKESKTSFLLTHTHIHVAVTSLTSQSHKGRKILNIKTTDVEKRSILQFNRCFCFFEKRNDPFFGRLYDRMLIGLNSAPHLHTKSSLVHTKNHFKTHFKFKCSVKDCSDDNNVCRNRVHNAWLARAWIFNANQYKHRR